MTTPVTRAVLVDASQRWPGPRPIPTAAKADGRATARRTVGDVIGRVENNGILTYWSIDGITRDQYGTVVTLEQVQ